MSVTGTVSTPNVYFKPLTGLRFIAALMVFFTHLGPRQFSPFINQFITELQAGVPIFFVLSGFLLCNRYYDKITAGSKAIPTYLWNRFVRIYPMYFIVVIGNIIWLNMDAKTALLNITLLHGFFSSHVFNPLPHTWSLTVEMTFYILLPLIFLLINKKVGIGFQMLLFAITGLLLTILFDSINIEGLWFETNKMLVLTFFGRSFEFLVGIKLALMIKNKADIHSKRFNYTYAGAALITAAIACMAIIGDIFTYPGILVHNIFLPVCIAILLIGLLTEKTMLSLVLSSPLFILLGNSSYAFFLIHYGFWQKFVYNYLFQNFLLNLLATILVSVLIYISMEKPLVKLLKRKD